ncbi:uncharacterized protein PAN0_021c6052 [Moesziomyces antarcticus]|uniref:Related to BNA4 - kynurenine 3-mono oxygenase n=2 Tax=Pseudozyma antarctica TaxID=84753 RepID=A0A5C3FX37_PSEA2|nr:uncharacterized protein PAN0_021c6052 [Moesziomyces antarcticus]GAK67823.1 conserved hypothetical protein [Moesziomyces antarcticus]SPO48934.1 related to BNA4 - kynurenine 3-mono oxygenase [Moesziomyces antarcticus]
MSGAAPPGSGTSAQPEQSPSTPGSMPASNSLLDMLAGAPARVVTSPPTSSFTFSFPAPSRSASVCSATTITGTTPTPTTTSVPTDAAVADSPATMPGSSRKQPQDVSHLMQQFMAPAAPLVILSPNAKSAESNDPIPSTSPTKQPSAKPQPAIQNKALQLPPSPPSSVSSASGPKLRQPSSGFDSPATSSPPRQNAQLPPTDKDTETPSAPAPAPAPAASPSVKTPFDFVSPFDMLSSNDNQSADTTAQPSEAQKDSNDAPAKEPLAASVAGYEAAEAGFARILEKLSASAAQKKQASQQPEASRPAPEQPKQEEAPAPAASSSKSPTRPAFRKLPSVPAHLDTPDKHFHASRHAAVLKQDDAFDQPKSSGLSVLSPSRSSSAPSIATLDLSAPQPGGLSSLTNTKVESSGVALISSPFHFPCNVSAAGLLPASRIANLGHNVACYAMSKGKLRLIHVASGARLLVQTPGKAAIRSIAAFASSDDDDTFLLAALTERSKEAADEGVVFWKIPASFVVDGKDQDSPLLMGRITADPYKSPFVYRFTAIAWHPTQPRIAISTSDSNVMVVDIVQQLLQQTQPASPSKKLRSLSELDVDPDSKDVAHNEPLCGFAFTPDGALLATISAPLEGDVSWILGFMPLDRTAGQAKEGDHTFLIKSPLQEPMIISHLSFITDKQHQVRAALVGFRCNTILGLYDMDSRAWKHVFKFDGPLHDGDKEHFNLVHFDAHNSTLLVCNSYRSSIFAVPLDFQPLPEFDANTSAKAELEARLDQGLLPWGIQLSYPIKEFALQDPCTSISISPDAEAGKPSRLFVAFPEGISILRLLVVEPPKEEPAAEVEPAADSELPAEEPEAQPKEEAHAPEPEAVSAPAEVASTPSKSSKKKKKRSKVNAVQAEVPSSEPQPEAATGDHAHPVEPELEAKDVPAPSTADEAHSAQHPAPVATPVESRASVSASHIDATLSDTVTVAVHDAVAASVGDGFRHSIESAIPKEVERLISSTELKAELTRNIAQTILPAVQRTAMEVVSRVLAPHFEDVMTQVSERAERTIVSEMTSVRKSLVAEQSESLRDTEKTMQAMHARMEEMYQWIKEMYARPQPAGRFAELDESDPASEAEKERRVVPAPVPAHSDAGAVISTETASSGALVPARIPSKCKLPERVAIIGAGPVGCLAALAFAQRGCKVDVFESRPDPRTDEAVARASQRSINLALSTRGISGLRSVSLVGLGKYTSDGTDLADLVLQKSVPMRARMIHVVTRRASAGRKAEVREQSQLYSTKGECINSVDRGRLNNILLDHALMHPNVHVHFEHKLQSVDFDHDSRTAAKKARAGQKQSSSKSGTRASERVKLEFDVHTANDRASRRSVVHLASFVLGCDGAHSSIRSAMGSLSRMHYTHNYIDTGYVELSIPPRTSLGAGSRARGDGGLDGKPGGHDAFELDPNHLHIWPRHSFMLIALPNQDGSFTCTLFAPFKMFSKELATREGIVAFFDEHFPDALPLIGADKLVAALTSRRASALGSVQCDPYHYKDRAVLIGDAAHAMLPFYGQGLNCGFEDVRVLFEMIDSSQGLEGALEEYTHTRHPDLVAIRQLAENNYREMAHSVVSWPYLLRKKVDALLMAVLPTSMWSSLYAMTTFSDLPYAQVIRTEQRQQRILGHAVASGVLALLTGAALGVYRTRGVWQPLTRRWIDAVNTAN